MRPGLSKFLNDGRAKIIYSKELPEYGTKGIEGASPTEDCTVLGCYTLGCLSSGKCEG